MGALKMAPEKLPRLDAIGGSSAGVIVNNRPMVASLFRGIPKERYDEVHNLFLRIREEMGVPLEIVNDGEVSALAGSMSMEKNAVLGIAIGSSLAAGYVTPQGEHHQLAERAGLCADRLQPAGAGRRMVGRPRGGRAVYVAAMRLPPGAQGGDRDPG